MVTHDAGGLGAAPDGHGLGACQFCGEAGLGDGVFLHGLCGGIGLLVGLGFGFVSAYKALGDVAALEHLLAVVGGMELADEGFDVDAALEVGVVQAGVGVLDGGGGDVCEDGTEVFGEAMEAAEGEFEPGDGVVEVVLVLGDVGSGEEGVYAVQEFVQGDLVFTGAYGLFVLPEIPLAGDRHRRLCGDPLRSSHRREDDIRRFAFHAVCVFSLDRISTTNLAFCLYTCKRVLQGEGRKL